MTQGRVVLVAAVVALAAVGAPAPDARADKAVAQQHYKRGMAAYALEDWDGAIRSFELGFREEPLPAFLFNIAQAHRQAGRLDQAVRFYRRYLELAPQAGDRVEVERLVAGLDREAAKRREAEAAAAGAIRPSVEKSPPPERPIAPPRDRRPDAAGLALVGTGGALVLGGVALAVAGAVGAGAAGNPSSRMDLVDREALWARSSTMSLVGYPMLAVGAALVAGGAVKLLLGRREARRIAASATVAPGLVLAGVGGSF